MTDQVEGSGRGNGKRATGQKVYLVLVPVRFPIPGRPNVKIVKAAPSLEAANEVANSIPGAYISKQFISRDEPTADEYMAILAR